MVDEAFIEELLENVEISFALHFFGIPADDSLGFPAVAHCLAPIDHPAMHLAQRETVARNLLG
jgi:hypothetical protein